MKAILEFDAPESCRECMLSEGLRSCSCDETIYYHCKAADNFPIICVEKYDRGVEVTEWPTGRASFCPLEIIKKRELPMKYRKKPVVIEAFQYDGDLANSNGEYYVPDWAVDAFKIANMYYDGSELFINTLEGTHHVSVGDYIIKGVNGELYPCKPDIFAKTYEAVEEGANVH